MSLRSEMPSHMARDMDASRRWHDERKSSYCLNFRINRTWRPIFMPAAIRIIVSRRDYAVK